jgi:hypothetical protein
LILLIGCGGEKPDEAARSWSATLRMTADKWVDNSVPSRFVIATCDSAQKALPTNSEIVAAAAKLRDAAQRGDRAAARRVIEELRR